MSDLSDRLSRAKDELGYSTRQISAEADTAGYRVSNATAVYNSDSLDNASKQLGHSEVGVTAKHYVQKLNIGPREVVGVLDSWFQSAS